MIPAHRTPASSPMRTSPSASPVRAGQRLRTLVAWEAQLRQSAVLLQAASLDLKQYGGWRTKVTGARRRAQRALGVRVTW